MGMADLGPGKRSAAPGATTALRQGLGQIPGRAGRSGTGRTPWGPWGPGPLRPRPRSRQPPPGGAEARRAGIAMAAVSRGVSRDRDARPRDAAPAGPRRSAPHE